MSVATTPVRLRPFRPADLARSLSAVAGRQGGLFTRDQARACGFTDYQIRRRQLSAQWLTVLGPVLVPAGIPLTPALRDRAASLSVPDGILAGPSAARVHGWPVPDLGQYLAIGRTKRRSLPGVHLLREAVPDTDLTVVRGLRVTTRARTLFDCVRLLPEPDAVELLALALHHGWTSWAEFCGRTRESAGLPGVARLAAVTGTGIRPALTFGPGDDLDEATFRADPVVRMAARLLEEMSAREFGPGDLSPLCDRTCAALRYQTSTNGVLL